MATLGLFATNMGACATAEGSERIGTLAEELGYDSLWMGEHVVAPSPRVPPSPQEPDYPILDSLVALGFMAAVTRARAAGDRDRDPAPAQPGGARQAARDARRAERWPAGLRHGRRLPRAGDARDRGPDGGPRRACGRVPAGDARAVGGRRARVSGPSRRVLRRRRASAATAAADPGRGRRAQPRRASPRGAARGRLVRIHVGPRGGSGAGRLPPARGRGVAARSRGLHDHGQSGRTARPRGRARLIRPSASTAWCWCRGPTCRWKSSTSACAATRPPRWAPSLPARSALPQ